MLNALAAADYRDRVYIDALKRWIEIDAELRHALGARRRGHQFGAAIKPGAILAHQVDLGIVQEDADALGDEVRVGGGRDRVGCEVNPVRRLRHARAGRDLPIPTCLLIHSPPRLPA